jgi:hypothetical protein
MYVIVLDKLIIAFGRTPEEADAYLNRPYLCVDEFDSPLMETHPCSPELYRQLEEAEAVGAPFFFRCEIDSHGVAVPPKDGGSATFPQSS